MININNICESYKVYMENSFGNDLLEKLLIVGYGSNIYNMEIKSDFDVCLIDYLNILSTHEKNLIINKTIDFQVENGLEIDEEVPFINKLIFNSSELRDIFTKNPFLNDVGLYEISDVVKTKEFLSSPLMKKRLFLNIFTTDRQLIAGNKFIEKVFEYYSWKTVIEAISNNYRLNKLQHEIVESLLYSNPYTLKEGEWYLGYKRNHKYKERYIRESLMKFCNQFNNRVVNYD